MDGRFVAAASAVTALAFLTRQQGALIVPAVLVFLLVTRRLRFDRASLALLLQIVTLPLLAAAGYAAWLRFGNDVPWVQGSFFREVLEEGWSGTWWLLRRLTVVELIYLGFFTLPLMAAVLPLRAGIGTGHLAPRLARFRHLGRDRHRRGGGSVAAGEPHAVRRPVLRRRRIGRA